MNQANRVAGFLVLSSCLLVAPFGVAAENQKDDGKNDSRKGLTVEEFKRGLRSASQNIEKEIPKIGPAIGETFKKHSNKESDNTSAPPPTKEKK